MRRIFHLCIPTLLLMALVDSATAAGYPRTVLIEEFTSVTCQHTTNEVLNRIIRDYRGRVVSVRYHTGLPFRGDPWYAANPGDVDTRRAYYSNIEIQPAMRIDGGYAQVSPTNDLEVRQVIDPMMESDYDSPILIAVSQMIEGNTVAVTITVTASKEEGVTELRLMAAAVEAYVHDESILMIPANNGETEYNDVMRTMIPVAASLALAPGESRTFTVTYPLTSGMQRDRMYTVAFVQDDFDQSVVQSGASQRPVGAGLDPIAQVVGFSLATIAPDPARGDVIIEYMLTTGSRISIHVASGLASTPTRPGAFCWSRCRATAHGWWSAATGPFSPGGFRLP